jgi:hypothetical protein
MMTCKNACRWGAPAKIFDGPVMRTVPDVRLELKRTSKGPEKDRLAALLTSQARLCWTCGRRCSEAEAVQFSERARSASLVASND